MVYAPKIVLKLPIADPDVLDEFVESCLRNRVVLICVWGPNSSHVEDLIDEIVVGDGTDRSRFITTTSHEDELLDDVIEFAKNWMAENGGRVEILSL